MISCGVVEWIPGEGIANTMIEMNDRQDQGEGSEGELMGSSGRGAVSAGQADCREGRWVCLERVTGCLSHGPCAPLRSLPPTGQYLQPVHVSCSHHHCTLPWSTLQQHEESETENRPLTRSPDEWWEFMLCPLELPWTGGVERVRLASSFLPLLIRPLLLSHHEKHRGSDIIK